MDKELKDLLESILAELRKLNASIYAQGEAVRSLNAQKEAQGMQMLEKLFSIFPPGMRSSFDAIQKGQKCDFTAKR